MKRISLIAIMVIVALAIHLAVKRSLPHQELLETRLISIGSVSVTGPVVWIQDKGSGRKFWLKLYTSFRPTGVDSLVGKSARIHYMKVLSGPLGNRIFKMEIDSILVFDQVLERNTEESEY
jgi:hypothetical protein